VGEALKSSDTKKAAKDVLLGYLKTVSNDSTNDSDVDK
tara:strand:- start:440 stop:553 length:114 start_codon:yes stop_codon:yes gene_type:complete